MTAFLVFRKKDLYLIITQKLTFMKSAGFHEICEIRWISGEIHPKPYKIRCFSKNSSVWGEGCMEGAMTPDFMKSKVIAPLLHSSNWIVFVETSEFIRFWVDFIWNLPDFMRISCEIERPLARNCNPMFLMFTRWSLTFHVCRSFHNSSNSW